MPAISTNESYPGEATLRGIARVYGDAAAATLPEKYLERIRYKRASVTRLPYQDGMFDRVFCISVLEHLDDFFNRHAGWHVPGLFRFAFRHDIELALHEFRRVLMDDGIIVLTFDYPDINLDYLFGIIAAAGLRPAVDVRRRFPRRARMRAMGLRCFAGREKAGLSEAPTIRRKRHSMERKLTMMKLEFKEAFSRFFG